MILGSNNWPSRHRKLRLLFIAWVASFIIAAFLSEMTFGRLRKDGPHPWTIPVATFLEDTRLMIVAIPLMYLTAVVTWIAPIALAAIYFSKNSENGEGRCGPTNR